MLGKGSKYATECREAGYAGVNFDFGQDLSGQLPEDWKEFNEKFIPIYMEQNNITSRVSAGLACGNTWVFAKKLQTGDLVLSPNGQGGYYLGEITGDYQYHPDTILRHRRPVNWFDLVIDKDQMSEPMRLSAGAMPTVIDMGSYAEEIEIFLGKQTGRIHISGVEALEDPANFVMEKHLEDFLVQNWVHTELGKKYIVFAENGEPVGQQYPTGTGPIDILAISKDQKTLLVIELKKGRASDVVVGQILRYMGYVKEELAEANQEVLGMIIALEDDPKLRYALKMLPFVAFYQYKIEFKLIKG